MDTDSLYCTLKSTKEKMQIREKFQKMLVDHGLFDDEATKVLDAYLESEMGKPMRNRMNDDASGYPESVFTATWMGMKEMAIQWIDKNMPNHWARGMFI